MKNKHLTNAEYRDSRYIIVSKGKTNFNHLLFTDNNEKIPGLHPMRLVTTRDKEDVLQPKATEARFPRSCYRKRHLPRLTHGRDELHPHAGSTVPSDLGSCRLG